MVDVSEITILKVKITARNVAKARYKLAGFLCKSGFKPGHWYANWKELMSNVWLVIGGSDRGNPSDPNLTVKILLRDTAPNLGGLELVTEDTKLKEYADKEVKPDIVELFKKSEIKLKITEVI